MTHFQSSLFTKVLYTVQIIMWEEYQYTRISYGTVSSIFSTYINKTSFTLVDLKVCHGFLLFVDWSPPFSSPNYRIDKERHVLIMLNYCVAVNVSVY